MPWCPKCREEYREGFRKCADCDGVWLVRELPDEDDGPEFTPAFNKETSIPASAYTDDNGKYAGMSCTPSPIDRFSLADVLDSLHSDDNLPQTICISCGKPFDFDYPKCPYCKHPAVNIAERIIPRETSGESDKPRRWRYT